MFKSSIVLIISLCFFYWVGHWFQRWPGVKKLNLSFIQKISINLIAGLLVNHLIFLIFRSYQTTNIILLTLGISSFLLDIKNNSLYFSTLYNRTNNEHRAQLIKSLRVALLVFLPIWFLTLLSPIQSWDARSSWFFQGHALANAKGLWPQNFWSWQNYWFPQWEYPKFFSSLVGQISFTFYPEQWDLYFPKLTLGFLVLPVIMNLTSLWREKWSSLWFVLSILTCCHKSLWDGYMDPYVALYSATSLLFWIRSIESESKALYENNFYLSIISMSILPLLKNEGFVLWLILLFSYFSFFILVGFKYIHNSDEKTLRVNLKSRFTILFIWLKDLAPWILSPLIAILIWNYWKSEFHLKSWLVSKGSTIDLFKQHWSEGWALEVLNRLVYHSFVWLYLKDVFLFFTFYQ